MNNLQIVVVSNSRNNSDLTKIYKVAFFCNNYFLNNKFNTRTTKKDIMHI